MLFPFEADFYRRHRVPVTHVGHPLVDEMPALRRSLGRPARARTGRPVASRPDAGVAAQRDTGVAAADARRQPLDAAPGRGRAGADPGSFGHGGVSGSLPRRLRGRIRKAARRRQRGPLPGDRRLASGALRFGHRDAGGRSPGNPDARALPAGLLELPAGARPGAPAAFQPGQPGVEARRGTRADAECDGAGECRRASPGSPALARQDHRDAPGPGRPAAGAGTLRREPARRPRDRRLSARELRQRRRDDGSRPPGRRRQVGRSVGSVRSVSSRRGAA